MSVYIEGIKNRAQYWLYKLYACIACATPLALLYGINYKTYIGHSDGGMTISFWVWVGFITFVIMVKKRLTEYAKKDIVMTILTGIFSFSLIMFFLAQQMMIISGLSLAGWISAKQVDKIADVYYQKSWSVTADGAKVKINNPYVKVKAAWKQAFLGVTGEDIQKAMAAVMKETKL